MEITAKVRTPIDKLVSKVAMIVSEPVESAVAALAKALPGNSQPVGEPMSFMYQKTKHELWFEADKDNKSIKLYLASSAKAEIIGFTATDQVVSAFNDLQKAIAAGNTAKAGDAATPTAGTAAKPAPAATENWNGIWNRHTCSSLGEMLGW